MQINDAIFRQIVNLGVMSIAGAPCYPLDSEQMPPPGPNFLESARQLGETPDFVQGKLQSIGPVLAAQYWRALHDDGFQIPLRVGNRFVPVPLVRGHLLGAPHSGLQRSDVMIIGKHPGREEEQQRKNFVGPTSQHMWKAFNRVGAPAEVLSRWYATTLVKWNNPNPGKSMSADWIKDCAPILHQELRIVRPRYILCLGADPCQYLTGEKIGSMRGRVELFRYPIHKPGEPPQYAMAQVMACMNPAQLQHHPEQMDELVNGLNLFWQLVNGADIGQAETDVDHRVIWDEPTLRQLVDEILYEASYNPAARILSLDAEWHGDNPWDPGSYLRTVQFSHKPKFGACVCLRRPGGIPAFWPGESAAAYHLNRLCTAPMMRIGGQFFRSDIPWFRHKLGIDLRNMYRPAATPELTRDYGGWALELQEHAINETAMFGLEHMRTRYTKAPPYELELEKWKAAYCAEHKIKPKDMMGFGDWDNAGFYSYACYDVDVPRRAIEITNAALDSDRHGLSMRKPYWINHRASLAVLEMEETGLIADEERVLELSDLFSSARDAIVDKLRTDIGWQTFNPDSPQQKVALLFGEDFGRAQAAKGTPSYRPLPNETNEQAKRRATKEFKTSGGTMDENVRQWRYILPEGVQGRGLTPIIAAGKKPKLWQRVVADGQTDQFNPSVNKEVLGILGQQDPVARMLRDISFLGQALKTTLRKPGSDKETGAYYIDDDGEHVYEKGLLSYRSSDGRIHTTIRQTLETRRSASSSPNLQNISKRREDDYKAILGYIDKKKKELKGRYLDLFGNRPLYKFPLRTVFKAPPGHVLMEADYTSAELAGIMWMAQDPLGMEHVRRNLLDEKDPDFYDIHSNMAVRAFNLSCPPTKEGLYDAGRPGLRVAAKSVVFGIPYGRGAEAMARQCREEGNDVSTSDAQKIIDLYFSMYPRVYDFLEKCKARVQDPGWIRGVFGGCRRFPPGFADDGGESERQACNYPIQNLVADSMWLALGNMFEFRERNPQYDFKFVLQIHDAVLIQVPLAAVPLVYRDVFTKCMSDAVEIYPTDLDGNPFPYVQQPYHLGCSREVMFRWGEDVPHEIVDLIKLNSQEGDAQAVAALQELDRKYNYSLVS